MGAVEKVVANLKEMSKPINSIEEIEHVATISANNDETIGKLIAMAVERVGKDGSITIPEVLRPYMNNLDKITSN